MRKVSLREIVADKIVFAILIALYYWMWARNDWHNYYTSIQHAVFAFTFFYFISRASRLKKYKQELPDEMSEANLKRCDALCLKIGAAAIIVLSFVCAIGRLSITTDLIGYCLMGILIALPLYARFSSTSWTPKEYSMALLTNLKTYREKYNLKQADLAELVGVRRETIVNLERGKYNPSLKLAMDIARVFHTTVEELFQYTDE